MEIRRDDLFFMREALAEALRAELEEEIPVGVVLVRDGEILVREHNRREQMQDPTAHAELLGVRRAARLLGRWQLTDVQVFVTLEPCPMCAGALVLARIDRLVFGACSPKAGAAGSLMNLVDDVRLNHRVDWVGGVLADESSEILRRFFQRKRQSLGF